MKALISLKTLAVAAISALSIGAVSNTAVADSNISGSISIGINGTTPEENEAISTGLFLYALMQGLNGDEAILKQLGNGNAAGIMQGGAGNLGIVEQHGDGHTGTLNQAGNGNAFGLFQFGEGTESRGPVRQRSVRPAVPDRLLSRWDQSWLKKKKGVPRRALSFCVVGLFAWLGFLLVWDWPGSCGAWIKAQPQGGQAGVPGFPR